MARIVIDNEHPDNDRFAADCAAWFGQPIITTRSQEFLDTWNVWVRERYLVGVKGATLHASA